MMGRGILSWLVFLLAFRFDCPNENRFEKENQGVLDLASFSRC
jgi:hypothetical protein